MQVLNVRNAHQALPCGLELLQRVGRKEDSRNGLVLVCPTPVMTVYSHPYERVLFWAERDANPFFHLMEALWMLAGRRDVDWIAQYNSNMKSYADNGILHGAYGYRWRKHFEDLGVPQHDRPQFMDQLNMVCGLLSNNPNSRRAVIQMWDACVDLYVMEDGAPKDLPCNTQIYLSREIGGPGVLDCLHMTVICRSNDIIWGAYGTNVVHFSMLQEYLAFRLGVEVGHLYQFSNNYHAYLDVFEKNVGLVKYAPDPFRKSLNCPYQTDEVSPIRLIDDPDSFDRELEYFMRDEEFMEGYSFSNEFLNLASVLKRAYLTYKDTKDPLIGLNILKSYSDLYHEIETWDFYVACMEWMERRVASREEGA